MSCKEICELLTAYLDGEVTPEEKAYVEAHLPGCPQCHAELEALSVTQVSLRGVLKSMADEVSPSTEAWEKVRAQLESWRLW
jgi:anti-sigma factor RsiW